MGNVDKYNTSSRLEELKGRVKRCCCRYCGGKLEIRRIVFSNFEDGRTELFCTACDRIEYGVEPEIYQSAKYFVEHFDFNWYTYLDENAQTRQMTIAKICDILVWQDKNLGFLDANGFTVPLKMDNNLLGESVVFSNDMLKDMEKGERDGCSD